VRATPGTDAAGSAALAGSADAGLDPVIQRIFTAGVLLGNALARGASPVAAIGDAVRELDAAVTALRSASCGPGEPPDDLEALAARLGQAGRDLSRLASTSPGDAGLSLRDAAYSVHRAQVAVSEAWAALTTCR
jgi:hypothetical protein